MKKNKLEVRQVQVKKSYGLNDWLTWLKGVAVEVASDFWGVDMDNPAEVTLAEDYISYYSHRAVSSDTLNDGHVRYTNWNFGDDIEVNFIQILENAFETIDDIDNPEERELAKEILSLDTSNPKYLKDINQHLNEAVSGMGLFVWASSWTTLHITDLNQNLDFKNILKKKGLI